MQAPLQKKTEIKVYILYVMKNIGYPVEFSKLNDTITADEPVNVFSFTECFAELLDTGNVDAVDVEGTECFVISERGLNVVEHLLYMLIPSVQKIALGAAARLVSFEKRGNTVTVKRTKTEKGYRLGFAVEDKEERLFSLEVLLENKEQAKQMENNLSKNPEGIYKAMLALLSGQINYLIE